MSIIPNDVEKKIVELGFTVIAVTLLYNIWSVVGLKGEKRYNIQLKTDDLSVASIHLLRYKYNQWGSRIMDVERVLIQSEKAENIRVI